MQSGHTLGDVGLPPWAASADDFIRKHRAALECDYVSQVSPCHPPLLLANLPCGMHS